MRVAIFSDVHGRLDRLDSTIKHAKAVGCDVMVCLGDVIDVKVSKNASVVPPLPVDQVAECVDQLAHAVRDCLFLKGNQEERFERLTRVVQWPESVSRLMASPLQLRLGTDVLLTHGHDYEWRCLGDDIWYPDVQAVAERVVVHGHRHRRQLLWRHRRETHAAYQVIVPVPGVTYDLHAPDKSFLVDVGPVFVDGSWILFQEQGPSVTWYCSDAEEMQ